jgi:xanthine dehydrogenase YagR molybdenum-binding subunit
VNADGPKLDREIDTLGTKGSAKPGKVGTSVAAVASAVFHATGRRVRERPIRIESLL